MKLLALETSTDACSAALWCDGEILSRFQHAPRQHAEIILLMIGSLLDEAGITFADVDVVAMGCGPGAFTGLRIAAGVTQGLAFAEKLPVVNVSTLTAVAQRGWREFGVRKVLAGFDARLQQVYWSACVLNDDDIMVPIGSECVCSPEEISLPDSDGWFGLGSAWTSFEDTLCKRLVKHCVSWEGNCYPDATDIAVLGVQGFKEGKQISADRVLPVYLRDNVAEKQSR